MGEPGVEEIKGFLTTVEQTFSPEELILFGNRTRGDHLKDSDYDIILVSRRF